MNRFIEKYYRLIIVLALLFTGTASLLNAWNDALTYDEVAHIPAGYTYVMERDYRINPEHPPLLKVLAGIPLAFMHLSFDTTKPFWAAVGENGEYDQWSAGRSFLYGSGNDDSPIAFWSRLPTIFLWFIFGFFLLYWGRELAGRNAGLFVFLLYTFNPNILGHNHYVTTDLGIAIAATVALYFFLRFLKNPLWRNVFLGGIFLGVAQVTKFSAVLLLPFFAVLLVLFVLFSKSQTHGMHTIVKKTKLFGEYCGKSIVAIFIAVAVIWITYIPFTASMPEEVLVHIGPGRIDPTTNIRNALSLKFILTTNTSDFLRPFGMYAQGLTQVFQRVAGGNGAYFLGEVSLNAFPMYFPTVFLIKEPLPYLAFYVMTIFVILIGLFQALLVAMRSSLRHTWHHFVHFFRTHFTETAFVLFIVFYSTISITGNLNIGFRHLFPIMPLFFLLTAKVLVDFTKKLSRSHGEIVMQTFIGGLLLLLVVETIFSYPFYLSYFNQAAGGPHNGYRIVTDSNTDWGQDLKRLAYYLDHNKEIDHIRVDYFGGGNPAQLLGEKYVSWWDSKRPIEKGWYAISTNYLQGSIFDRRKTDEESYRWLLQYTPVAQVGTSIFIYHITSPDE